MKKKIFIVKGYAKTAKESSEMDEYINKYYNYFLSKAGGAWDKNEVLYLDNPTSISLKEVIEKSVYDYTLSVFIGHGGLQESKQLFQINKNEVIKAGQFINGSPKQMIIFESCRSTIENIATVDISDKPPKFRDGGRIKTPLSAAESRNIYERVIAQCPEGLVVCFACDAKQYASNFYFSYGLLSGAIKWHLNSKKSKTYVPITKLMTQLNKQVNTLSQSQIGEKQTPVFTGDIQFPFIISKH